MAGVVKPTPLYSLTESGLDYFLTDFTYMAVMLVSVSKKKQVTVTDTLLNVQKAALFLDVSPGSIRKWAQQGKLIGVKIGSRGDWRFTKQNLLKITREGPRGK